MGKAYEVIPVAAVAPSTGAAFPTTTGFSLTIRQAMKRVLLAAISGKRQTGGFYRLSSPLLHDTSTGIQLAVNGGVGAQVTPILQELFPQDTLTSFGIGSATAGDVEANALHVFYEDLPGVAARLASWDQIKGRIQEIHSVPVTVVPGTTGFFGTGVAINSTADQFKANRDYALLGMSLGSAAVATVVVGRVQGPDTGNLPCGLPVAGYSGGLGNVDLSILTGLPMIPVINAANKGLTTVAVAGDENAVSGTYSLTFALLDAGGKAPWL